MVSLNSSLNCMADEVISKEIVESYIFTTVRHDFGIYSERLLLRLVELAQREIKGLDFKGGTNLGKVHVGEWGVPSCLTRTLKSPPAGWRRWRSAWTAACGPPMPAGRMSGELPAL